MQILELKAEIGADGAPNTPGRSTLGLKQVRTFPALPRIRGAVEV